MTARSTLFRCRTPETPNHISVSTARDVASPSDIPMSKMDRVFTEEKFDASAIDALAEHVTKFSLAGLQGMK